MNDLQKLQQATESVREGLLGIGRALQPAVERFGKAAHILYDAMWNAYRQAGAPYGETEEGLQRWIQEEGEKARAREEATRREAWEAGLNKIRQRVREGDG